MPFIQLAGDLKLNPVIRQIKSHSSVREFSSRNIERELLTEIIECGQAASSSNFVQACTVIRVQDEKNRARIAAAAGEQRWVVEAAEFLVLCADMQRIQYCCKKSGLEYPPGYTEHFMVATIDVALMGQNMLLAAESAGLGGVFIGGIRNNPQVIADCLKLPDQVYPVFGLCLGWPVRKMEVKPRLNVEAVLHEDAYVLDTIPAQVDAYDLEMADYYAAREHRARASNWSQQTATAVHGKRREHMLTFLQGRGFLKQ